MRRFWPALLFRLGLHLLLVPGLVLTLAPQLHASPGVELELCGPSGQRLVLGPDGRPQIPRPPCPDCLPGPVFAALPPVWGAPQPPQAAPRALIPPQAALRLRIGPLLTLRPPPRAPPVLVKA